MSIITTSALATWLGIPDSEDDARLRSAASATNRAIIRHCGRTFETTTTASASTRTFRPKTSSICYADDFWTTDALVVKIDDDDDGTYETTLTDYFAEEPEGTERTLGFPYRKLIATGVSFPTCNDRPSVQITAAWGWEAIPDDVTLAALLKGARLFKRKDSVEGILGGFQDFNAVTVRISNREDPDVAELLREYRTTATQLLVT